MRRERGQRPGLRHTTDAKKGCWRQMLCCAVWLGCADDDDLEWPDNRDKILIVGGGRGKEEEHKSSMSVVDRLTD